MDKEFLEKFLQTMEEIKSEVIKCREVLTQIINNGKQVQNEIEQKQKMAVASMESLMNVIPEPMRGMMQPFMKNIKEG